MTRLEKLKAMLKARANRPEYAKNCEAIRAEIARRERALAEASA